MKKFNITVNGKSYEVEVEELGGVASAPRAAAPAPKAAPAQATAPAQKSAPAPKATPVAPVVEGGETVLAPMPGTILDIKVNVGDMINKNDVVVVLEAMKMENEICAQASGKIVAINVTKGASVNSGDVLLVIG